MQKSLALLAILAVPASLSPSARLAAQQEPAAVRRAAATITPADIERRLWIIANDSMMGRATPSEGLNKTARYVADQFRRFGLKPGGENGTFFQWYSIEHRRFDGAASQVSLTNGGTTRTGSFGQEFYWYSGGAPAAATEGDVVVLGWNAAPDQVDRSAITGKIVLLISDWTKNQPSTARQLTSVLRAARPAAVIRVANRDSTQFALMAQRMLGNDRLVVGGASATGPWVEVRDAFVAGMGLDLAAIRGGDGALTPLAGARARLLIRDNVTSRDSAPNTIGILEGSDPRLKSEFMIFSGHMDHIGTPGSGEGCAAIGADSICNGADDDGSGTTGVVEVAEAFSQRGVRPKRSMVFMTVSGEERGLWGSKYWNDHPTIPVQNVVADFNVDMVGRNWEDTVVAIGRQHSNLGQVLDATAARHPELRMTPIDDIWPEQSFYTRSDHFNFAQNGIPVLFFFTGVHEDYHKAGDEVQKIGFGKMSRILQLLFYTSYAVAQNPVRPQWNPASWDLYVSPAAKALRAQTAGR